MLEKFSPEEIRQIKKELREMGHSDVQKITIFEEVREEKVDFKTFVNLPHRYEFEKAAYLFADVMTDNFLILSRKLQGTEHKHEYKKGNTVVPFEKSEEWSEIISALFDMYLKKYKE